MADVATKTQAQMVDSYPAVHAHSVRKAAMREDEAGNPDFASELRDAMRFIEKQADLLVSVEALLSVIDRHGRWIRNSLRQDEFTDLEDAASAVRAAIDTQSPADNLEAA